MIESHQTEPRKLSLIEQLTLVAHPDSPSPFLEALNGPQREAVETLEGPLLVLACAGTGKTRVLTSRIANIITSRKAWPSQILAVTFTNKAAAEMRYRAESLTGPVTEGMPWLGTFHSVSAKILRRHAELVGLRPDFTILDTNDQTRLIKQLLIANNVDTKRKPERILLGQIDYFKNRGWGPDQVVADSYKDDFGGRVVDYYRAYQQRLKTLNAVDFGDLILEVINIMKAHPDILSAYHDRFRYIMVDEYQDSNVAQYLWLRLFSQGHNNLCCVGDDDQSIYGWRGAEVGNILRFERDFQNAKTIRLEENYRSTAAILATASHLIAHNKARLEKTLKTKAEAGEKVWLINAWDSEEEARKTVDDIEQLCHEGERLDDMAILVRASSQMRAFEDIMAKLGMPYRVIGGPRFYERQEIRDAVAYLRLVHQKNDDLAFERIINVPKRGIGGTSFQRLVAYARLEGLSLYEAARELVNTETLRGQARVALRRFIEDIDRWHIQKNDCSTRNLADMVLEESGYTAMWQADKSVEAPGRLENLKELSRSLEDHETLAEFLEQVALVLDVGNNDQEARISLMTLHAAKGLEFNTVYLPGWEEGLFPSQRSLDEGGTAALEEERRLAYVGITRARKRLRISYVVNRKIYGYWQASIPSRFINELDPEHIQIIGHQRQPTPTRTENKVSHFYDVAPSSFDRLEMKGQTSHGLNQARLEKARQASAIVHGKVGLNMVKPLIKASLGNDFSVGDPVWHDKFGRGRIVELNGNKARVAFDDFGESDLKSIIVNYLKKP